jgi:hypothetical protein
MNIARYMVIVAVIASFGFATQARLADLTPCVKVVGDEQITTAKPIPYLGPLTGPGDSIGHTAYDYQSNGSMGTRIMVDGYDQAHIDWMWCDYALATRYCAWQARFSDGSFYGETQASNSWSGYVQLDITRDASPDSQRTVIAYHFNPGAGYYGWIDIDQGNCYGAWPNDPKTPAAADHIWPYIGCASNGNIVMATGDQNLDMHHMHLTTDEGSHWTSLADFDSCACLSQFLRASHNSNKVVFVHTQYKEDSTAATAQLDCDVFYMLSTDGGVTWSAQTNLTNYSDSVRAYCNVNAGFDANDHLHIFWAGRRVDAAGYYEASKIFHWDEVTGNIHIVSSPSTYYSEPGGWWIATASSGSPGAWRMPADQPQMVVDAADNTLYCLWGGNDDYNDSSSGGFFNGEIYGSKSVNGGVTWTPYTNLTNTRTPGGAPGACADEDYFTAHPWIVNDSIFVTYVDDLDAGGYAGGGQGEGTLTDDPVRCWVFPKTLIGIEENKSKTPNVTTLSLAPNPATRVTTLSYTVAASGNVAITLYDATGCQVEQLENGYRSAGVYSLNINTGTLANGTYFVVIDAPNQDASSTLVVVH